MRGSRAKAFSLSTLFLVMTLIGVSMGLVVRVPAVGGIFVVLAVPVFSRTAKIIRARQAAGMTITPFAKVRIFLNTLAIVTALVAFWCVSAMGCLFGLCSMSIETIDSRPHYAILLFVVFLLGIFGLVVANRWNKTYEENYQHEIDGEEPSDERRHSG